MPGPHAEQLLLPFMEVRGKRGRTVSRRPHDFGRRVRALVVRRDAGRFIRGSSQRRRTRVRAEELLLIRAEANLALGNTSAAIRDLNLVRERAGGLEPLPEPFPGDLLRQLLYEKRYSLMWEGGFTYLEARQYDRMGDDPAELPRAAPNHVVYPRYPYPINECHARDMLSDVGCQPVVGF